MRSIRPATGRSGIVVVALLLAASGCGGDSTSPRPSLSLCPGGVTMTVDPSTTPEFTWAPQCGVMKLTVREVDAPQGQDVRWEIVARSSAVMPPVRYGVLPAGVSQTGPAVPLVADRTYRANVFLEAAASAPERGSVTFIAIVKGSP